MDNLKNVPSEYLDFLVRAYEGTSSAADVVLQLEREQALRDFSYDRALRSYEKSRRDGTYANTEPGRYGVSSFVDAFAARLEEGREVATRKQRGPKHQARYLYSENQPLSTRVIAFIALRSAIDGLVRWNGTNAKDAGGLQDFLITPQTLEGMVATRIYEAMVREWAKDVAPMSFMNWERQVEASRLGRGQAMRALQKRMALHNQDYILETWDRKTKHAVGMWVMQMMIESCGFISLRKSEIAAKVGTRNAKDLNKQTYVLEPEFVSWLLRTEEAQALRQNYHEPMVIPPQPWSEDNLSHGPYLNPVTASVPVVKGMNKNGFNELLNSENFGLTLDAVNAVQNVAYSVNGFILDAVNWAVELDDPVGDLPKQEDVPYAPYEGFEGTKQEWVIQFHESQKANSRRQSRYLAVRKAIEDGETLRGRPIWFPHNLDSRGRIYPLSTYGLSPQGADFQKAMLTFHEGTPIVDRAGLDALYVACATEGAHDGMDKASLAARVAWVEDNLEAIKAIGEDFRSNPGFWDEADHPFMFLATCREIYEFHKVGYGFVSHLPTYTDATCSGIQHYSALLLDERGGKAVNLVPGERQDVYGTVAQAVVAHLESLEKSSLSGEQWEIRNILLEAGCIDRKTTKRIVMTVPYNAKEFSSRRYVFDWIKEMQAKGKLELPDNLVREAGTFLTRVIWAAVANEVPAAIAAMRWIEAVTKMTVNANPTVPLQWDLPDGMVCMSRYGAQDSKKVRVLFEGQISRIERRVNFETDEQVAGAHANAMPPNLIHSLDAAHLRLTATMWEDKCAREGRTAKFTFVHDSFGVPAQDMPEFAKVIRESFIRLYGDHDHVGNWLASMQEIAGPEVTFPERPSTGSLDLQDVAKSEFFFS